MNIRIAITDDHIMVINGLQKLLENTHIEIVSTYSNGKALLKGLTEEQPDVLLLDIHMPGQSGEELMPLIREQYPELRILIVSGFEDTFYVKNMIQLGALGYILKSAGKQTIIDAIESVYQHKQFVDPELTVVHNTHRFSMPHIQKLNLTPREKEVLKLISAGHSSNEIAEKLSLGKRTVENYRMSLLLKLDVKNVAMLVKKAIELRLV
jgi:DNA-binding NarL/FixJ family response regulator